MRGLTPRERELLETALLPILPREEVEAPIYPDADQAVLAGLQVRGLIRPLDVDGHVFPDLTSDGELALRLDAAARGGAA